MNGQRQQRLIRSSTIGVGASVILALSAISAGVTYVVGLDTRIGMLESQNIATARGEALQDIKTAASKALDPLPVGTIIASVLKPELFLNGRKDKWHLADASIIPHGKLSELVMQGKLEILGDSRLPDLRGMFLRGQNHGRNDSKQDPDVRVVGSHQSWATGRPRTPFTGKASDSGEHSHSYNAAKRYNAGAGDHARAKPDGHNRTTAAAGRHSHEIEIAGGGDIETRPSNISVFFYIKVD